MSRSLRVGEAFSLNFHYFVIWRVKEGLEVRGLDRLHSVSIFYCAINAHKVHGEYWTGSKYEYVCLVINE